MHVVGKGYFMENDITAYDIIAHLNGRWPPFSILDFWSSRLKPLSINWQFFFFFLSYLWELITAKVLKGPFILQHNRVVLMHCTLLHRNWDVTALRCRMEVKFIWTSNLVMLQWLAAETNRCIGSVSQLRGCSINGPWVRFEKKHKMITVCVESMESGSDVNQLQYIPAELYHCWAGQKQTTKKT